MSTLGPDSPAPTRAARIRFAARVDRSGGQDACWPYLGTPNENGYMRERVSGRVVFAHRIAFWMANGPIPTGLWVLHHCDNPPCCNPSHLFLGTQLDNVRDAISKNRMPKFAPVLTPREVAVVRGSGWRPEALASRFGVSKRTVYRAMKAGYIEEGEAA